MGERLSALMLLGLELWTGLGAAGLVIARLRGEGARFRRGLATLFAVWVGYGAVLVGVSLRAKPTVYPPGRERCFNAVCFEVTGAEEPRGFLVRGQEPERLLRVVLRIRNGDTSHTQSEDGLAATLLDAQGRHWEPVPGLGGVRLTTALAPGGIATSEPVFRPAKDATGLRLLLRHTGWTPARLRIGGPESYFHPPAEMVLPEPAR